MGKMLKYFKKLIGIICVMVLIGLLPILVCAENTNVAGYRQFSEWAKYLEIKYQLSFYETEYSSHYPSFAKNDPAMNIRKWEVANIIYTLKEEEYKKVVSGSMKFADEVYISAEGPISVSNEQLARINKLHTIGIIPDNGNGLFGIFDEVTYKELSKWLDNAKFPIKQLDKNLKIQISDSDKVTVEQFLAILDIVAPDSIETIQNAFIDTYTRNWIKFQNVCTLHTDKEVQTLIVTTGSQNIDRSKYYPFHTWATEIGRKYDLIFTEDNTREATRGEFVNLLYYLLKIDESDANNRFSDLYETDEALRTKINSMASINVISGYEDGTFRPYASVSRAEFVTMLDKTKLFDNVSETTNVPFNDVKKHWAEESIKKIAGIGLLAGKGNGMFCPDDNITPQEIFVILDRLVNMKYITKEDLLTAMQNTFSCEKYDETDEYVIETIYSKFDQVQNDIKHKWPYNVWTTYYAWEDWNSPATYNDLIYALYLASNGFFNMSEENLHSFEDMILEEGLNINDCAESSVSKLKGNTDTITWREALYALYTKSGCGNLEEFTEKAKRKGYFDELAFSNTAQLSDKDKAVLWALSYDYTQILENYDMYFNMDGSITKYMLNYIILKCQNTYKPFHSEFGDSSTYRAFFASLIDSQNTYLSGYNNIEIETDESKLPKNYDIFPYIVKGVPKEVYEIEGIRQICTKDYQLGDNLDKGTIYCNPLLCYSNKRDHLIENTYDFYNLILNVDYRTMNIDDFVNKATSYAYPNEELARTYAQYVIDNKIILKGKGCAIPGTVSIADWFGYVRVMIEFEIISAEENVDILYGDFINPTMGYYDRYAPEHIPVKYENNKYFLYFDQSISGTLMFAGEKYEGVGYYRVVPEPIIRDIYLNDYSVHTLY